MSKERLKSPRARLFVALDLPEGLRQGIVTWGGRELRDPALRVVSPQSLHITLAFLGYLPEREIDALGEVVRGLDSPAATVALGEPVAKPSLGRARLFALPAASPGAVELQSELEGTLVAKRLFKPEKRPFWPHVTVARVKSAGGGSKRPAGVQKPPGGLAKALLEPALCVRVTLYRSELQPQGARYTPLAQVELSRDGRQ
ncbi:MAG: 2,3-cyclic 3-phosphodiesterase [Solirubrobacterales bacterium]|jgi:2'-5' RNA ligase|nr:2,3-cyclic 3-phosphodiesterase [Solirubrobacterales bacterium]